MSAMSVDYEKMGLFYLGRQFDAATRETTQDLVLYDSRDLTTHAVCVGMTGSGRFQTVARPSRRSAQGRRPRHPRRAHRRELA
jgi:hypothetical protein